jgi:hypothetical protein
VVEAFEHPALPAEAKAELTRLRTLSERAQTGDAQARRELREALDKTSPQLIDEATDFTRLTQRIVIKTISGSDRLMQEALPRRLEAMRREIGGENCTALEQLLVHRVVSLWLVVEVLDVLMSGQLQRGKDIKHASPAYMKHIFRWQESVNRRFLSSIRELSHLRKLQSNVPGIQHNTQINVQSANIGATAKKASEEEPYH